MPELPEVETTRLGVTPHILRQEVVSIEIRERRMRWPIEDNILAMVGHEVSAIRRRAKYLLIDCKRGTLMLHLGMSGSLRICPHDAELRKHDHLIVVLSNGKELRLHDPRRFGSAIWIDHGVSESEHPLLRDLGPEPLSKQFSANYLIQACLNKKTAIKKHIMNNKVVVGVGNIYACEALFLSGIHPKRAAERISAPRLTDLRENIRLVLQQAIQQGGTTLRDFVHEDGKPGYFQQQLNVYGRDGETCQQCKSPIKRTTLGNRSTFYCAHCQH